MNLYLYAFLAPALLAICGYAAPDLKEPSPEASSVASPGELCHKNHYGVRYTELNEMSESIRLPAGKFPCGDVSQTSALVYASSVVDRTNAAVLVPYEICPIVEGEVAGCNSPAWLHLMVKYQIPGMFEFITLFSETSDYTPGTCITVSVDRMVKAFLKHNVAFADTAQFRFVLTLVNAKEVKSKSTFRIMVKGRYLVANFPKDDTGTKTDSKLCNLELAEDVSSINLVLVTPISTENCSNRGIQAATLSQARSETVRSVKYDRSRKITGSSHCMLGRTQYFATVDFFDSTRPVDRHVNAIDAGGRSSVKLMSYSLLKKVCLRQNCPSKTFVLKSLSWLTRPNQ